MQSSCPFLPTNWNQSLLENLQKFKQSQDQVKNLKKERERKCRTQLAGVSQLAFTRKSSGPLDRDTRFSLFKEGQRNMELWMAKSHHRRHPIWSLP